MENQTKLQLLIVGLCTCSLLIMAAAIQKEIVCYKKEIATPIAYLFLSYLGSILLVGAAAVIRRGECKAPLLVKIFFWVTVLLILMPILFLVFGLILMATFPH